MKQVDVDEYQGSSDPEDVSQLKMTLFQETKRFRLETTKEQSCSRRGRRSGLRRSSITRGSMMET